MFAIINIAIRAIAVLVLTILAGLGIYKVLPEQIKLNVPFTSQAPEGVWTEPWQNACEEASIIMIDNFYNGDSLTKDKAKTEILNIFDIKEKNFGPSMDESMQTVATIINNSNLGWTAQVVENPTVEQLKTELAAHQPIIVPVDGHKLNNPYYTDGGPDYHVLVVVGYDDTTEEFITHDPATQFGQNFRYGYKLFYDAINDFLESDDLGTPTKRVLYTRPVLTTK